MNNTIEPPQSSRTGTSNHLLKIPLVIFAIAVICISLGFYTLSIGKPYSGISISKTNQGWTMVIDKTGHAHDAGISESDTLIEINGEPADDYLSKYANTGMLLGAYIHDLTTITQDGEIITFSLDDASASWETWTTHITWFVLSAVFWVIGLIVFYRKSFQFSSTLLLLCSLALGMGLAANLAAERGNFLAGILAIISTVLGPWFLFHFFLIHPKGRTWPRNSRIIFLIYLPALITLALLPFIGFSEGQPSNAYRILRLFGYALGFIMASVTVIINYFQAKSIKSRQQAKIILVCCLAALIPIIIFILIPITFRMQPLIAPSISILFFVFIPMGMGYSVLTKKYMNIDVAIRRVLIQSGMVLILASIFAFVIILLQPYYKSTQYEFIIYVLLGVTAAIIFGPLRSLIVLLLDKFLYKSRYDIKVSLSNLKISLANYSDFRDVSRIFIITLVNILNTSGACLFLKNQLGTYAVGAGHGIYTGLDYQTLLIDVITNRRSSIEFPNPAPDGDSKLAYIVPLNFSSEEVGILCLSVKNNQTNYSIDDMYFIQEASSYAAMSLARTFYTRNVNIRDTFISIASHELRSPLTVIMGYADLLNQKDPPEETRKAWTGLILENGKKLASIVDDMLNVSRIQSGKMILKLDPVSIQDLINKCIAEISETTDKHSFNMRIAKDIPFALVDYDKFWQVIGNLLNNAVKYSPNGGEITVSAQFDKRKRRITIAISDQGVGISTHDQEMLFTTFHRIRSEETRGIPGTGLGLFIVKSWVEAMNGSVSLESELSQGSTFSVEVPIA